MATKAYSGQDGSLLLGDDTLVKVTGRSLQADLGLLETTSLSDGERSYTPGLQSFTGKLTLLYYKDTAGKNDASTLLQKLVRTDTDTVRPSTSVLTLRLADGTSYSDVKLEVYLVSASISAEVGDIVTTDVSFRGTGKLQTASM